MDHGGDRLRRKLVLSGAAGRDADPDGAGATRSAPTSWRPGARWPRSPAACVGYAIGALLYDSVGAWLIQLYGYGDKVEIFRAAYAQWGAWIILLKGLTPIPYKIVTITSGFAGYNFVLFIVFSIIARAGRFFLLAFLLHRYGEQARHIIEKRLGLWVTAGRRGGRHRHRACGILDLSRIRHVLNFATRRTLNVSRKCSCDGRH